MPPFYAGLIKPEKNNPVHSWTFIERIRVVMPIFQQFFLSFFVDECFNTSLSFCNQFNMP